MKKLIACLVFLCLPSWAQNFSLTFENEKTIIYNPNDWVKSSKTHDYELYVDKYSIATNDKVPAIYSMVEFNSPNGKNFEYLSDPVKRIYTYGVIECKNALFHLLTSWYVDKNGTIVLTQKHEFGMYEVEMWTKNTPRNDLFLKVCSRFQ